MQPYKWAVCRINPCCSGLGVGLDVVSLPSRQQHLFCPRLLFSNCMIKDHNHRLSQNDLQQTDKMARAVANCWIYFYRLLFCAHSKCGDVNEGRLLATSRDPSVRFLLLSMFLGLFADVALKQA